MRDTLIITNARIVTEKNVISGSVEVRCGKIISVDRGNTSLPGAVDFEGDYLIAGMIELHTDNMEKHFTPRPGVAWPPLSAAIAHDVQIVGAGITTVYDAISIGDIVQDGTRMRQLDEMVQALKIGRKNRAFRADHYLHMRCELSFEGMVDLFRPFCHNPLLKLVSLMDHSPGERQFLDIAKYREYYQGKYRFSDGEMDDLEARHRHAGKTFSRPARREVVALCREHALPMASHDDATAAHVAEAAADGVRISEFPTTTTAAAAARENGMRILMGAPNAVRGLSHSGNVSARDLAAEDRLDILSSDYIPGSLLHAAFAMHRQMQGMSLPRAIAMTTRNPAHAVGLSDRGEIAPGKRADLIRVREIADVPVVVAVWTQGQRV